MTAIFRTTWGTNTFGPNNPPSQPAGMETFVDQNNVSFFWDASTDDLTPSEALTYNLYVGADPGTMSEVSAVANPETGYHLIFANGNAGQNKAFQLYGLPAGTYYWSVQAQDLSRTGSLFAPEQSFEITWVATDEFSVASEIRVYPNPSGNFTILHSPGTGQAELYQMTGQQLKRFPIIHSEQMIDLSSVLPGLYFLKVIPENHPPVSLRLVIH